MTGRKLTVHIYLGDMELNSCRGLINIFEYEDNKRI